MLTNDPRAIAQREALARIVGDRHIKRGMARSYTRRSRDDPATGESSRWGLWPLRRGDKEPYIEHAKAYASEHQ